MGEGGPVISTRRVQEHFANCGTGRAHVIPSKPWMGFQCHRRRNWPLSQTERTRTRWFPRFQEAAASCKAEPAGRDVLGAGCATHLPAGRLSAASAEDDHETRNMKAKERLYAAPQAFIFMEDKDLLLGSVAQKMPETVWHSPGHVGIYSTGPSGKYPATRCENRRRLCTTALGCARARLGSPPPAAAGIFIVDEAGSRRGFPQPCPPG